VSQVATHEAPTGPILIVANHVTAYDGALVLYALPRRLRRRIAIAMSGEILLDLRHGRNQSNAFVNALAPAGYWLVTALFNVFPLPRLRGFRASFAHTGEAMDRGYSVLIFPEGTRSPTGRLQHLRPGTGILAQDSQVPILPVALLGLHEARTRNRWFRPGLTIRLGALLPPDPTASPEQLTARLEASLEHLLAP
jgi:long-chain acyl-CoA synthetase